MKRLLIFLICAVLALSSLSIAAGASETIQAEGGQTAPGVEKEEAELADTGATADEITPTGWSLLTEAQFQSKMASMRSKYPHGSIWEGVYYEDGYAKAWTCWAYAAQMMKEFFGVRFYADGMLSYKYYDSGGVCAGDWVRIDYDSHSIFITKVTSSGVYYTDGNGTGVYNQVRWDGYYSWSEFRSRFSYRIHLPGNTLTGAEISHTVAYSANGGSGSVSSETVAFGSGFTLKSSGFSRSGYTFEGFFVKRSYDDKWFTSDAGWQTKTEIYNKGYHFADYYPGEKYKMSVNWLGSITSPTTFTFYAQWVPVKATVEYFSNYSGYNYILGSDLSGDYDDYIYSRDDDTYTVSVDSSEKLNNAPSLKIKGTTAGSSGSDLAFVTSTNKGYGNGYSQMGLVGDEKNLTLHFYAKSSVEGAKMYFRWGYSSEYIYVTLSKSWKMFSINIPKNRFFSAALHPYFDKAGTFYLNSLALGDSKSTSNVVPETGRWAASDQTVTLGGKLSSMPTPYRDGYTFLGWYTAAEGGDRVTTSSSIYESTLRLYAHWSKDDSYDPVKTVYYGGHRYELYDNTMGWEAAADFCWLNGGHLITIENEEENSLAFDMISDRQGYCWIGLQYHSGSGKWVWEDDTDLGSYNKWYSDDFGKSDTGEHYALLYPMNFGVTSFAGTWDKCVGSEYYSSYYGYRNSFFICEYDSLIGDADKDGEVTLIDATMIQYQLARLKTPDGCDVLTADIDDSGDVDMVDAAYIRRYVAGIDTPYDIGKWTS